MTDSQRRQCSNWGRENTHQSPLSQWLHHVTAEGEHLQIKRESQSPLEYFPPAVEKLTQDFWESCERGVSPCEIHKEAWSSQGTQRREEIFTAVSAVFQACFITCKTHQGRGGSGQRLDSRVNPHLSLRKNKP